MLRPEERDSVLEIQTPRWCLPLYQSQARYQGASGGRGSGKSHYFAEELVEEAMCGHIRAACMREVQMSIKDSVKQLIEDKIDKLGVRAWFKSTDREIVGPHDSLFIFRGLRKHTSSTIKSLEGFNRALYEEAQTISQRSIDLALPTFRTGAQQRFAWNPEDAGDPVDKLFLSNAGDPDFCHVHVTYRDNPFFPPELLGDVRRDKRRDLDKYQHVWLGRYFKNRDALVFKNWETLHFDVPSNVNWLHGADWGYSIDPTVLIRGFVGEWVNGRPAYNPDGKTLFITHEKYKVGLEIDDVPEYWDAIDASSTGVAREWPIIADSNNPQNISYLRRHGYPRIRAAHKGPNSVMEGVKFLQNYDIVVHPRCYHTRDELGSYRFKVDPLTELVIPVLQEDKNHVIDSLRYMVEPIRLNSNATTLFGSY